MPNTTNVWFAQWEEQQKFFREPTRSFFDCGLPAGFPTHRRDVSYMRVVIHIGLPKTGTTSIQRWLLRNGEYLADTGYLYPRSALRKDLLGGHFLLFQALKNPKSLQALVDEIHQEAEARAAKVLLLSSEALCHLDLEAIRCLCRSFDASVFQIVVYLRNIYQHSESIFKHQLRANRLAYLDLSDFAQWYVSAYNYCDLVNRWATVFGEGAVSVRVYDRVRRDGNLIDDYASISMPEIDLTRMTEVEWCYESLSRPTLEVLYKLRLAESKLPKGALSSLFNRVGGAVARQTNPGSVVQGFVGMLPPYDNLHFGDTWRRNVQAAEENVRALQGTWLSEEDVNWLIDKSHR